MASHRISIMEREWDFFLQCVILIPEGRKEM